MILVTIQRDIRTSHETCGWLHIGAKKWPTIEPAWVPSSLTPAGLKGNSCVPPGEYKLEAHSTDSHQKVWALVNQSLDIYHWPWEVPKYKKEYARDVCLVHAANWASELEGCIAPGLKRLYDQATGRWMVRNSRDAINEIRSTLGSSIDVKLIISEAVDGSRAHG